MPPPTDTRIRVAHLRKQLERKRPEQAFVSLEAFLTNSVFESPPMGQSAELEMANAPPAVVGQALEKLIRRFESRSES